MKTVVVTGARGAQQGAIADAFDRAGWRVRPTARTATATRHGEAAVADLASGEGLGEAFEGADVVATTLPQDHRPGAMTAVARCVTDAAAAAGVPLVAFNFATRLPEGAEGPLFEELAAVSAVLDASPVSVARIETTVFMENLLQPWAREAVGSGVLPYPIPEGVKVAWISHKTLGEAVVAAAGRGAGRWTVGGPQALSGDETAAALSAVTGHQVRFVSLPLADFAAGIDAAFDAPAGERITSFYAHVGRDPTALAPDGADAAALGLAGETLADFLERRWRDGLRALDRSVKR